MVINHIHISRFGAFCDREIDILPGLNIIEGENESGKTTVAAFLRWLFYGVITEGDARYLSRLSTAPSTPVGGSAVVTLSEPLPGIPDTLTYRISRSCPPGNGCAEQAVQILPLYDGIPGDPVYAGEIPGVVFFGVSGDVFSASAFVGQVNAASGASSAQRSDSESAGSYAGPSSIQNAIDRILYAANEEIDPDAAIRALSARRRALYDPETESGSIHDMERRRAALASALEEAERAAEQIPPKTAEQTPAQQIQSRSDSAAAAKVYEAQRAALAACEDSLAKKKARADRLQKVLDQYEAYCALDDLDTLNALHRKKEEAEKRASALSSTMFRGGYRPDADFAASLHLCADDMRQAADDHARANAEMDRLDFSVRRDNIKETQMRRIRLDGGAEVLQERLDALYKKRSLMTVFGIVFLLGTVFALAITAFLLILQTNSVRNGILITAALCALAVFFFVSRSRYQRTLGVMLRRYACQTENELENFLEEYMLSEHKLISLSENKEALNEKLAASSLRGSEAARQAALLLSRLQPPDAPRLTADRMTADLVASSANRVDRTLEELARLEGIAADCEAQIRAYVTEHGATSEEALRTRRKSLSALFASDSAAFRIDAVLREMESNIAAVSELREERDRLRAELEQSQMALSLLSAVDPDTVISPVSDLPFTRAETCDIGQDPRILRALIAEMDETLRRDRKTYAALNLAIDATRSASIALHDAIAPRLTERAGKLMSVLSDHRYSALLFDDGMNLRAAQNTAEADASPLPIDALSAGTQDLAYLSLRMALLHMLYPHELPPLLFDEAFATLDDHRLSRMIALLHRACNDDTEYGSAQALVFTCHKRERRAAQTLASCNVLKL